MSRTGGFAGWLGRWLRRAVVALVVVLATIVLVRAWDASRPPYLKPWHRLVPASELHADEMTDRFTLADYLRREDQVFREVKEKIEDRLAPEDRSRGNRYDPNADSSPRRFASDGNRTFELVPPEIRGGVLLLHGLTDAPYSMRATAEIFRDRGFYALSMRMPGHGTVPGALTRANWKDWIAAVRVGARHVRERIGPGKPFYLAGYSNGGALAVKYSLDVLEGARLPKADGIVLMSPMIGVSPAAALARAVGVLAVFPYFEKTRWLDVVMEYNPFKYNSFPANAGYQTGELTGEIQAQVERVARAGHIGRLPRMLAFVSIVDATVSTNAVVWKLYDRLADNGSELVLFDVNRSASAAGFLRPEDSALKASLEARHKRPYTLSFVTNQRPDTSEVVERSTPLGALDPFEKPLHLAWPPQVYSLSHVAIPFPPDDPLYGGQPNPPGGAAIHLGLLAPRGERGVLVVSPDQFLRISWNPFFPYVEERIRAWIGK